MIKNIKARFTAKKFNIYSEKVDPNRKADGFLSGDWLSKDGIIYYGHPAFIFFRSCQNDWWLEKSSEDRYNAYYGQ